jgi:iron complex outermembrane recepter protein
MNRFVEKGGTTMRNFAFTFIATALSAVANVSAQDAPAEQLGLIEVLGSHIRGVDLETRHPIMVIDRADIERTGLTSISDIVQLVVANGQTANRNINNGNNGEQLVDLRSLGFNRTLVLLNGSRFVSDIGGAVDLSGIPLALVERVEVLLDGASAIYGSDAIAGVINIVTRRDYDGGEFGAYFGKTSYDDGERRAYDVTWGRKGNGWSAAVGVEYGRDDPIFAKDRTISSVPIFGLPAGATGSTSTPFSWLLPHSSDDFLRLKDGAPGTSPSDFRTADFNADRYNFAPQTYLQIPQERRAVFAQARYEFSPTLALVADALFNQRRSEQQLASSVIRTDATNTGSPDAIAIAADNVYNPFGEPIDQAYRRLVEAGPRLSKFNVDSTRVHVGLDGAFSQFDRDFIWSADATDTRANQSEFDGPYLDNRKLLLALGPSFFDASGTARCGKPDAIIDGCVPMNLFGPPGSITAAMLDYAGAFETNRHRDESRVVDAHLSTSRLFDLPDGALAAAAGAEYRRESGAFIVDPLDVGGYANGNGGTVDSTHGAYSVSEAYLELEAPLLADKPFAHKLDLGFGTRYSRYSNFGGTLNSQVGLRWQPIEEMLVRANYAQGFRAPAITELFSGASQYHDTGIIDPCDANHKPKPTADVLARCAALGVPANVDSSTQEGNVTFTGNTQLQPETSRSRGVGVVYTPMWTSGLDVSVDWYNIRLRDAIGNLDEQSVVDQCYTLNNDAACAQITRNPSDGSIFHVLAKPTNFTSGIETEGYDLALRYRHETPIGQISARWDTNYVIYFGELGKPAPGTVLSDGTKAYGNIVGLNTGGGLLYGVVWRWRSQAQLVWDRAPWSVSITGRYFSHIDEDCSHVIDIASKVNDPSLIKLCSNPDPAVFANDVAPRNRVASVTFTDLEGSWESPWQARFTLGVRNAFDRSPPVAYTAYTNSFFPDYDAPGRFWYVRYQQRF